MSRITFIMLFLSLVLFPIGIIVPIYLFKVNNNEFYVFLISLFSACIALAIWWYNDAKNDKENIDLTKKKAKENFRLKYLLSLLLFFASFTIAVYAVILIFQEINITFKTKGDVLSVWAALATLVVVVVTAYYLVAIQGTWTQARDLLTSLKSWETRIAEQKIELAKLKEHDYESLVSLAKQLHELSMTTYQTLCLIHGLNVPKSHVDLNKKFYNFARSIELLKEVRDIKKSWDYNSDTIGKLKITLRAIDTLDEKNLGEGVNKTFGSATERENIKLLPKFYYESLYEYLLEARCIIKEDITEKELNVLDDLKRYIESTHL